MKKFCIVVVLLFLFNSCSGLLDSPNSSTQFDYFYINDYEYEFDRYYFLDEYYKDYFEVAFNNDPRWYYGEGGKGIKDIDVFISSSYADANSKKGIASINPENYKNFKIEQYDDIQQLDAITEKGYFKLLERDKDYFIDKKKGIISFRQKIDNSKIISVAYKAGSDHVGTLASELEDNSVLLNTKLIKCKEMRPSHEHLWGLTMRNVYQLPDSINKMNIDNIKIEYLYGDGYSEYQKCGTSKTFLTLLGWDILDEDGNYNYNGDGKIDNNNNLFSLYTGKLMFPSLKPFDPDEMSIYQLSEYNRAKIYNISELNRPGLLRNSYFRIVILVNKN